VQYGLDLLLADCDYTWNAKQIGSRKPVNLVMLCPVLGNPSNYSLWEYHLKDYSGYVIEDACESVGAWIGPYGEKRRVGTFGIMSTFSFFASHQISGIEGGMILTNNAECARLCKMLRSHGWTRDTSEPQSFADEYDFHVMGYNLRPLEINAAIARAQLRKLEDMRRHRQQNLNNFTTWAHGLPITMQVITPGAVPSPFGIAFTVESTEVREALVVALRAAGIDCRLPTGGSFRKHPYAAQWSNQETPNADAIHETGLFLGNGPLDLTPQIEKAIKVMRGVLL